MTTNKWKIQELMQNEIDIVRVYDNIPIFSMHVSVEENDELLTHDEAIDIAEQIVEHWNSDCEVLEAEYDHPFDNARTRDDKLQAAADAGYDTWEDYRGEK